MSLHTHRIVRIIFCLEANATSCAKYLFSDLAFFLQAHSGVSFAKGRLEKFVAMEKTGNQLCEPGAPRREGEATLLKFGCGVVSIKIAGINISRGEKRFTRFPRKEMIPPHRAAPFGYKSPARSIILMSIRRALIATRLINRELYL